MRIEARILKLAAIPGGADLRCEARSANDILFVFIAGKGDPVQLGDTIELDAGILDVPQSIVNQNSGTSFQAIIGSNDVHDVRLPASHGTSRRPSKERLNVA